MAKAGRRNRPVSACDDLGWAEPAPERLGSGSVIDYGYQGSVLLPVQVRTPATLVPGVRLTLSAEVSWLVCNDICVPGQADLTLALPVRKAPGPVPAAHTLFQEASARLPKPMPPAWRAEATSEKAFFLLTIHGADGAQATFFPLEADQIDNAAPQTATMLPGGVRLALRKSDQMAGTPARLDGVLDLGPGRVYAVSVPVHALPGQADEENAYLKQVSAAPTAVLLDPTGRLGHLYDAKTSPHIFIVDPSGKLIYNGAIDDQPSPDPASVAGARNYVSQALAEAMAGKPVSVPTSRPYGCSVKYAE